MFCPCSVTSTRKRSRLEPRQSNRSVKVVLEVQIASADKRRSLKIPVPKEAGAVHLRTSESEPLTRWAALIAVLAAMVATPAWIASVVQEDPVSSWPIIATLVALLLAVPALFAVQASHLGLLGR